MKILVRSGSQGITATDVAKAMSVKKDPKNAKRTRVTELRRTLGARIRLGFRSDSPKDEPLDWV
jgi:hypothetical protein